jgi:hypothetical protein
MKKAILILVIGLFWCNASFAECIEGNCKNGQGTYTWTDGAKYVGEFKDGKFHGQGTFTFPDGRKYVGEYKDGSPHGQGTFTFPDGDKYVGEFKDGKFHGQGTYTFPNGDKYVGEFKDDKRHGQGTYTYADGTKEVGEFKNDGFYTGQTIESESKKKLKNEAELAAADAYKCYQKVISFDPPADRILGPRMEYIAELVKNSKLPGYDTPDMYRQILAAVRGFKSEQILGNTCF